MCTDSLYAFDEADEELTLLPMAARRALDVAGLKLSLAAWKGLALEQRRRLVAEGSGPSVRPERIEQLVAHADPAPVRVAARVEPLEDYAKPMPPELATTLAALEVAQPVTAREWQALRPLDRYALEKIATRDDLPRLRRALDEIRARTFSLSHLNRAGEVHMVGIAGKMETVRTARAQARVQMRTETLDAIEGGLATKGDVLAVARIAGIQAAKRTPELIPLCHAIRLTRVEIELRIDREAACIRVDAQVEAYDRTGVEMEALIAASTAALTIYDMLKSIDRWMTIEKLELVEKTGGRSGTLQRS